MTLSNPILPSKRIDQTSGTRIKNLTEGLELAIECIEVVGAVVPSTNKILDRLRKILKDNSGVKIE